MYNQFKVSQNVQTAANPSLNFHLQWDKTEMIFHSCRLSLFFVDIGSIIAVGQKRHWMQEWSDIISVKQWG